MSATRLKGSIVDSSRWDVFVCHASEDKESFVRPLARVLSSLGAKVWYDEFTIGVGDSLSRSIDKGLVSSQFGIVVLSPDFFKKDWPEYELRGLVAKELGRERVILPIWHGVEREDVLSYSPPLADKIAIRTCDLSTEKVAIRILEVIRPDLLTKIGRRLAYKETLKRGNTVKLLPENVMRAPIRHKSLTRELIRRIRLIRAVMLEVYPGTMNTWINAFRRDSHPSHEVAWWEHFAACYIEFISIKGRTRKIRRHVFAIMMAALNGNSREDLLQRTSLSIPDLDLLLKICESGLPVWEVAEELMPDLGEDEPEALEIEKEFPVELEDLG